MAEEAKKDQDEEAKKPGDEGETEAEGEGGEEGLNPPKKKLGKKKLILIGVAVVVLLIGAGAGLYFSGVLGGGKPAGTAGSPAETAPSEANAGGEPAAEGGGHGGAAGAPVFFSLGDILVNLTGDGKRPNFLKIKVSLELSSEKDKAALDVLKPRIIDNFQVYLRELRVEDLRGSAGLYRLREELLLRVTEAVKPIRVKDVLFQEMLVQ